MYRVSICDENQFFRDSLEKVIRCYFVAKGIKALIKCFEKSECLLKYPDYTDIVFLGMDRNRALNLDIARILHNKNPNMYLYIISNKYTYLDDAMDLKAFRYLSKTLDINRIITSLDMIVSLDNSISFMSNYTMIEIKETEIACIFSKDRRTFVLTDSGEYYPTTLTIKNWLCKLSDSRHFLHPHYSYIVNKKYIHSFDGRVITLRCKDGKTMEVYPSQRRMTQVRTALTQNRF
ncbi:MAG: LytTR family transcriptional regulator [Ruminococcaceae bacterium]|nr:LytTR family transcriptional regulator [Oscillospiraceae bacterium]